MKKKIELADQKIVKSLEFYVAKVLRALGHPEALVTDESMISDFMEFALSDEYKKAIKESNARKLKKLSQELGFKVKNNDYIYKVAEKLRAK